jgi:hypothetical protein
MEDWIVKNEGTAYCKTYFFKESLPRIFLLILVFCQLRNNALKSFNKTCPFTKCVFYNNTYSMPTYLTLICKNGRIKTFVERGFFTAAQY